MLQKDIAFIFLYIAAFGISDYFIDKMKIKNVKKLFYYFIILAIGLVLNRN